MLRFVLTSVRLCGDSVTFFFPAFFSQQGKVFERGLSCLPRYRYRCLQNYFEKQLFSSSIVCSRTARRNAFPPANQFSPASLCYYFSQTNALICAWNLPAKYRILLTYSKLTCLNRLGKNFEKWSDKLQNLLNDKEILDFHEIVFPFSLFIN